jgi:WD40 repeat protein
MRTEFQADTPATPGTHPQPGASPHVPDHELLRLIGRGSYGEVWLARNVMGTYRAVKIVYRQTFETSHPFEREFAGIQKFEPISRSHEGMINVLHVGRSESGDAFYYVMELADDAENASTIDPATYRPKSIRSEIVRRGRLPLDECVRISLSLANALGHLHKRGLIHRDVKPSNIIFVNGLPKLADNGLVSELGESRSFVGTEGFIPPEGPGSAQADIYSLGKVLYEMSTGKDRLSFPELPTEWVDLSHDQLELEFHEVLLKACEGQAARRYKSADELHADLALLQTGKSVRRLRAMEKRLALFTRAGIAAGVLMLIAIGGYLFAERQARIERQNFLRVERAEREAREQLVNVYLAQARADRNSGQSGHRFNALAAIANASSLLEQMRGPSGTLATNLAGKLSDLRDEAAATLALSDIRPLDPLPAAPNVRWNEYDIFAGYQQWSDKTGAVFLRPIAGGDVITLTNNAKADDVLPLSADGKFLPAFYNDGSLRIWEIHARESVLTVRAPGSTILEFTPDSAQIAISRLNQRFMEFYALPSGEILRKLPTQRFPRDFRFSPDGELLAIWFPNTNFVEIIDVATGEGRQRLEHSGFVASANWHPSGRLLATGDADFKVSLWDPHSGKLVRTLNTHQAQVQSVVFHPNGQLLASTAWDGTTRLFEVATGRQLVKLLKAGQQLQFNRDGSRLMIDHLSLSSIPIPWCEVVSSKALAVLKEPDPANRQDMSGPWTVRFSPDGRLLASASYDGVRVWDTSTMVELQHFGEKPMFSALFDQSGEKIIGTGVNGYWEWKLSPSGNGPVWKPVLSDFRKSRLKHADASADGSVLAFVSPTNVYVRQGTNLVRSFYGSTDLHYAAISRDGQLVAAVPLNRSDGFNAYVFKTAAGQRVGKFPVWGRADVAFTPDNQWLVTGSASEFCFWNLETLKPDRRIKRMDTGGGHGPIAFSADGKVMALTITRTFVQLREYPSLKILTTLQAPDPQMISWLCFDHLGRRLAVANETHIIHVWDLRAVREELAKLRLDWK